MTLALGVVAAGAAVLIAFGVHLTHEQTLALCNLAQAALSLAFYTRSKVTPTRTAVVAATEPPPLL